MKLLLNEKELLKELTRIESFINNYVRENEKVVVGLSGGLDSDVVARIAVRALGNKRVKIFTVLQTEMEDKYLKNARNTASDLGIHLVELELGKFPYEFMKAMEVDTEEEFRADGLIDPSRAKCSLRTIIFSTYQDRGYIVIGTSNQTEIETGFYLPFGDALGHIKPIAHLYKSQVRQLAKIVGVRQEVIDQPASAGFWKGQVDLEDMAYWIYNEKPIGKEREFTEEDDRKVNDIYKLLTQEKVDTILIGLKEKMPVSELADMTQLPENIIRSMGKMVEYARNTKNRPIMVTIDSGDNK